MRKLIITVAALAALAALVVPTAAMADVAVNDQGVGFVGKGDVQDALDLDNDAAIQTLFASTNPKGAAIVFTKAAIEKYAYSITCANGTKGTYTFVTTSQSAVNAQANTNGAGKLTNGWNLTGLGATVGNPVYSFESPCGDGGFRFDSFTPAHTTSSGDLMVNGIPLPNTPAV
jgi:hypothetical protein